MSFGTDDPEILRTISPEELVSTPQSIIFHIVEWFTWIITFFTSEETKEKIESANTYLHETDVSYFWIMVFFGSIIVILYLRGRLRRFLLNSISNSVKDILNSP